MSAGDPSPTEEELEAIRHDMLGVDVRKNGPHIECESCRRGVERLFDALRSARESARVATRERDLCCEEVNRLQHAFVRVGAVVGCPRDAEEIADATESVFGALEERTREAEAQLIDRDRMIAQLRDALETVWSSSWDSHLGKGLSKGYAQSVTKQVKDALDASHPIVAEGGRGVSWCELRAHEETIGRLRRAVTDMRKGLEALGVHRRGCQHIEPGGCTCGLYDLTRGLCPHCHGAGVQCVAPGEIYSDATCGNCRGTGRDDALTAAPPGEYEQRVRREALDSACRVMCVDCEEGTPMCRSACPVHGGEPHHWQEPHHRKCRAAAIRALASKEPPNAS